jgi:NodT family efflux transporter outer membrane factor (OMF) lipoprotein
VTLKDAGGRVVAETQSDDKGRFAFGGVAPGIYAIVAEQKGFQQSTNIVTAGSGPVAELALTMASDQAPDVRVAAQRPNRSRNGISVKTGNSHYSFQQEDIKALPHGENTAFNDLLLRAPGIANDNFGQLHIRGDHADIQYRINGVILSEAITSFGSVLDTRFASSVNLLTEALPAQSGYRTAGVVEIDTMTEGKRDEITKEVSSLANSSPSRVLLPFIAALALLPIAGCTVGPDFKKPAAPDVGDYTARPLSTTVTSPNVDGGEAQRFVKGLDISADWWTLFHSRPLNDLIEQSITNNHDLKAAQAALSVARENALAQRGAFYPSVAAGFSASRQQQAGTIAPTPSTNAYLYNLFTPQVSVSYVPDVFGLTRRTVESFEAQAQAVRFQMIATYNTLTANVVVTAIQAGSLQMQIEATRQLIDFNSKMVEILQYQFAKGYASRLDVAAQESQLAQVAATLPPLLKQATQVRDLLAVLAGRFPDHAPTDNFALSSLQLPEELPVSLPSALVEQRPDVLQATANLHAASAQIGIATANRLPNITLTAIAGNTALATNQLFDSGTGFWALGADVIAPIFNGGALLHLQRAAQAAYVQAAEQYRSTVLTAFQNVADTLTALEQDAEGLKAAAAAAEAAKVTLDLSQRQYQIGYAGYLSLLSAEQAYQQARINLVQAQANRYADTAALIQALGGGWWHRADLVKDTHEK